MWSVRGIRRYGDLGEWMGEAYSDEGVVEEIVSV
jgi:hypothetical protein